MSLNLGRVGQHVSVRDADAALMPLNMESEGLTRTFVVSKQLLMDSTHKFKFSLTGFEVKSVFNFKHVVTVPPVNLTNPARLRFKPSVDWVTDRKGADGVNTSP